DIDDAQQCTQMRGDALVDRALRRGESVVEVEGDQTRRGHDVSWIWRKAAPEGDLPATVGVTGFEPAASSSRTKRATKLRHTPLQLFESTTNRVPHRIGPVASATRACRRPSGSSAWPRAGTRSARARRSNARSPR